MDEAELKRQRWLKIIVIGLGLLILLLLGTVITTILIRGKKAASKDEVKVAATVAGSGFGDIKIALPQGARFEEMKAEEGRLYVRVSTASGAARVLVLDSTTGQMLGSFEFSAK